MAPSSVYHHVVLNHWVFKRILRAGYGRYRERSRGQGAQQRKRDQWHERQWGKSHGKGKGKSYGASSGSDGYAGHGHGKGRDDDSGSVDRLAWQAINKLLDRGRKWKTKWGRFSRISEQVIMYLLVWMVGMHVDIISAGGTSEVEHSNISF